MPLPFQLLVTGRPVLLIGSGEAATAKQRLLIERGANVTHWQSAPSAQQLAQVEQANLETATRFVLAVVADEAEWARGLIEWIRRERMLLNVVDAPSLADGFIPAIVSRGLIQIGIGSGGQSPVLARFVRTQIERVLPTGLDRLSRLAERWRDRVMAAIPEVRQRRRFWETALAGDAAERAMAGDDGLADQLMTARLSATRSTVGRVSLVGAGPGDASLLTLRGLKRLQEADIVLYDKLVGPEVLQLARRDAILEDVGKRRGHCPMPQAAICSRMVELAKAGNTVCRLKGGDPLMFGRGGEEAEALRTADIAFEIVPGITTASAVAASTGMPLTHRGIARSVRFLTGHLALDQVATNWQALAARQETLVLYMGFTHLDRIAAELIAAGVAADLPIAAIQNASRAEQRVERATLGAASGLQQQFQLKDGPVIVLIGEVTALALQDPQQEATDGAPLYWRESA